MVETHHTIHNALNLFGNAVRWTYRLGQTVGHVGFVYVVPAVLVVADFISWVNSYIDWAEVAATVVDCLKTIISIAIVCGQYARIGYTNLCAWHAEWVGTIEYTTAVEPARSAVPASINPLLDVANDLQSLTANSLRSLTHSRRRCSKTELIATYLAY